MTTTSGCCSPAPGATHTAAQHQTCTQRMAAGLLAGCGCEWHHTEQGVVGTGAGEGAPRQDTGSAWVTRSADCPEAPAQAHHSHDDETKEAS
jgi:hypothetical protein